MTDLGYFLMYLLNFYNVLFIRFKILANVSVINVDSWLISSAQYPESVSVLGLKLKYPINVSEFSIPQRISDAYFIAWVSLHITAVASNGAITSAADTCWENSLDSRGGKSIVTQNREDQWRWIASVRGWDIEPQVVVYSKEKYLHKYLNNKLLANGWISIFGEKLSCFP